MRSSLSPSPAIFVFEASTTNQQAYEAIIDGQSQGDLMNLLFYYSNKIEYKLISFNINFCL